jgi:subtilase family serine protease
VQACADAPKSVSELNETNNCGNAAQALTVLPVPNLLVSSMTNPPAILPLGSTFKLTNSVRNVGSGDAGPATRSTTWSPSWTERRRLSRGPRSCRPSMTARPSARRKR